MLTLDTARVWYEESDIVHGFAHIERVYMLVQRLASSEGADLEIVSAAALLHDVQGSGTDKSARELHHIHAADFSIGVLKGEGWTEARIEAVHHCILSHRYRDEYEKPQSLEARVLYDADKLDAIGATGVMRAILYAVQHGKPVYEEPSVSFLTDFRLEDGENHSAFHEYIFKLKNIRDRLFTPTAQKLALDRQDIMVRYFESLAFEMQGLQ